MISHDFANKINLKSIRDERNDIVSRYVKGRLLDIGCGMNLLVNRYGKLNSIGIDVHDFGAGATIVKNSAELPFEDNSFDTVSFVASFNHIPNREEVVLEARRVLRKGGVAVVTMLDPFIGKLRHKMDWVDKAESRRFVASKQNGEQQGLSYDYIENLFLKTGFKLKLKKKFLLFLNNLYVFEKI